MKKKITEILLKLGIKPNLMGFNYIRDAVLCVIEDEKIMNAITTKLYPYVAKQNDTTDKRVERAIRHATQVAAANGKLQRAINEMYHVNILDDKTPVSNSEIISLIAEKIFMERL